MPHQSVTLRTVRPMGWLMLLLFGRLAVFAFLAGEFGRVYVSLQFRCWAFISLSWHTAATLLTTPASFWSGKHKPAMLQRLVEQFKERKVIPIQSNTAGYKLNKNVPFQSPA